jgi:dTDP-D-glucose 4,6-dehydratase
MKISYLLDVPTYIILSNHRVQNCSVVNIFLKLINKHKQILRYDITHFKFQNGHNCKCSLASTVTQC